MNCMSPLFSIRDVDNLKRDMDRLGDKMGRDQARQGDVDQVRPV